MSAELRPRPLGRHSSRWLAAALLSIALLASASLPCRGDLSPAELLNAGRVDELLGLLAPKVNSKDAAALNSLGRAYYALGQWDSAVRYAEQAVRLEPRNARYQLWLGRCYGEKADHAGAFAAYSLARKSVAAFRAARSLDSGDMEIARDLGEYYSAAPSIVGGGSDRALALASELAAAHPSEAAWLRARTYDNDKNYALAEAGYKELIRIDRGTAQSYLFLARYYRGRKNWQGFDQAVANALSSTAIRAIDRYDAAEAMLVCRRNLAEAARQMRAYLSGPTVEEGPAFRAHFLLAEILLAGGDKAQAIAEYRASLALASGFRPAAAALERLGNGGQ